jgi:flagellar basal-body rod protein FlgG
MLPAIKKQESIANNIANVSTPGFKKDGVFTKELSRAQQKAIRTQTDWQQPMADRIYTDYTGGAFDRTDNPLDMAIDGDGFFQVELEDGRVALTRSGTFTINRDGLIAHTDGPILLADGGAVEPGRGSITISPNGQIEAGGNVVGRITPVTVDNLQELEKIGSALFIVPGGTELVPMQHSTIRQGYLEESNVDIVKQMINMIVAYRTYESNARAVSTQDASLENLFRRVGDNG